MILNRERAPAMTFAVFPPADPGKAPPFTTASQDGLALAALALAVILAILAASHGGSWRHPALAMTGVGLGFVLFQSAFGFAGSFRAVLERRDFAGFRGQAAALALASLIFYPLLAQGSLFGMPVSGFGAPVGISFVAGAVLFGIGMQIGGGCASGTLFALGGGSLRLVVTLAAFIAGSVLGAASLGFWRGLPAVDLGAIQDLLGWPLGLAAAISLYAAIFWAVPAPGAEIWPVTRGEWLRRPWPLLAGAAGLAALNGLTLVLAGRPWGETSGFTLWGSKLAAWAGMDAASFPYWRGHAQALNASVFADITSVMDFGIILGATMAAALSCRFRLRADGGWPAWAGAVFGGLLMGYGARLSDGCNIGAYFSALASGSLSALVWVAAAFAGSALGLRLRPLFHLD